MIAVIVGILQFLKKAPAFPNYSFHLQNILEFLAPETAGRLIWQAKAAREQELTEFGLNVEKRLLRRWFCSIFVLGTVAHRAGMGEHDPCPHSHWRDVVTLAGMWLLEDFGL